MVIQASYPVVNLLCSASYRSSSATLLCVYFICVVFCATNTCWWIKIFKIRRHCVGLYGDLSSVRPDYANHPLTQTSWAIKEMWRKSITRTLTIFFEEHWYLALLVNSRRSLASASRCESSDFIIWRGVAYRVSALRNTAAVGRC